MLILRSTYQAQVVLADFLLLPHIVRQGRKLQYAAHTEGEGSSAPLAEGQAIYIICNSAWDICILAPVFIYSSVFKAP